jgi:chorismate synthase
MNNSIGKIFKLTTFGESHGEAIGGIIEGVPAGLTVDFSLVENDIKRRNPSNSPFSTSRVEPDRVEFLSGIFEGKTLGTPIAFVIKNRVHKSSDYKDIKDIFRASHADYGYFAKYGIRDYRGGGRASARETVARVVGGAFAKMILKRYNIKIVSYVSEIASIKISKTDFDYLQNSKLNMPDEDAEKIALKKLEAIKNDRNSAGGVIDTICSGIPAGLGEPVFDKLEACLAKAVLSIPAAKGIEFGDGFKLASMTGKDANDEFTAQNGKITTKTNHNGGILGGISTGNDIFFRTAFKPVSSIPVEQKTVTVEGENTTYIVKGRHDVTVVPRATVIVESMTAIILADMLLRNKTAKF